MHSLRCPQLKSVSIHVPEGKLNLVRSKVNIIINGENSFCLYLFEWQEPIVKAVPLTSNHLG